MSGVIHSLTAANAQREYEPWFRLRNAIFEQAFMDWENCKPKHRNYVLNVFSKLPQEKQKKQLALAYALGLRWTAAAEIYLWFQSPEPDYWLVDCDCSGADLWRLYVTGDWNRGGIKNKPYKPVTFPTAGEMRRVLPDRFSDMNDMTFAGRAFPERHARQRAKEYDRRMKAIKDTKKEGNKNDSQSRTNDL